MADENVRRDEQVSEPQGVPARTLLNADDFGPENLPYREQCRQLLEEVSGDAERIRAWNRMRNRIGMSTWYPELSDAEDPWEPGAVKLCTSKGQPDVSINLIGAILEHANLSGAKLRRARLVWAKCEGAGGAVWVDQAEAGDLIGDNESSVGECDAVFCAGERAVGGEDHLGGEGPVGDGCFGGLDGGAPDGAGHQEQASKEGGVCASDWFLLLGGAGWREYTECKSDAGC